MKFSQLIITCLFVLFASLGANSQTLDGKSVLELETMQKDAIAKEDYDLASKIKQQLKLIDGNNSEIEKLEKEKETAILIEDYDRVIFIEKEIEALKNGKVATKKEEKVKVSIQKKEETQPPQTIEKLYKNGKISAKGQTQNGKAFGLWELYTKSGFVNMTGQIKNGKPMHNMKGKQIH